MAKLKKKGLDYFPMGVDMLDSDIAVAITGKFGYVGFQCLLRILCSIYKNGYWTDFGNLQKFRLVREYRELGDDGVNDLIDTLCEWKFFDAELYHKNNILTSVDIQKQYFEIIRKYRAVIDDEKPYLLIDINDTINVNNDSTNEQSIDNNCQSLSINVNNDTINDNKCQYWPEKKRKENKTKENISKERTTTSVVVGKKDDGLFVFGDEKTTPEVVVNNNPKRFVKPTVDEVKEYITAKGYTFEAQAFMDYYESNGWKVGRNAMKDWRAAASTWQRMENEKRQSKDPPKSFAERMYDERKRQNLERLADMDLRKKFFVNGKSEKSREDRIEYEEYKKQNIESQIKIIENDVW